MSELRQAYKIIDKNMKGRDHFGGGWRKLHIKEVRTDRPNILPSSLFSNICVLPLM
jgi:hypothetical protein